MEISWPVLQLGEIVKIKGGKRLPKGSTLQSEKSKHPYIRVRDMGTRYIPTDILEYVPNDVFPSIKNYIVEENDVIISIVGTIGLTSIIDKPLHLASQTENCAKLSGLDSFDAHYIYYYLNSYVGQQQIKEATVGAVQSKLPLYGLNSLSVIWPERHIRENIVHNLITLDDKIELNNKINHTLEQMAQALFKSWFVDFDPVFDNLLASADFNLDNLDTSLPDELKQKAQRRLAALNSLHNAAEYKASLSALAHELQAQLPTKEAPQAAVSAAETPVKANLNGNPKILVQHANTHAHFPNEFEHNEQLGWIPKGWEDVKVNEMVRTVSETYPLKSVDKVIFLNTGDILEGKFLHSEFSNTEGLPGQAKKSIKKGDILYSEIRPKNKRFALVNFDGSEHVVSTKLMVLRPNEGFEELFPYFVLTQEHNISLLQQAAESRSGTFPQITFTELAMIKIALPKDKKLINIFISSFLKDHFAQKDKRDFQNKTLTKLRDTLLPKLISGELQIPDVAIG